MRRKTRRLSQQLGVALATVGIVAGLAWYLKPKAAATASSDERRLLPQDAGPPLAPPTPVTLGSMEQVPGKPTLVSKPVQVITPATAPSAPTPAQLPLGVDAFKQAQAKRDAGDILAARGILNDQLIAGLLTADQQRDAKLFIQEMNQRIVFSNAKLSADPYNARAKVEPGHSLTVIARQFDISPELLGRINGISDPRRLRAGVELKAIKGPFHAVVSKSHFTIDLYLGAPGGQGSTYITTYRVGLGSDASTPTGTWLVTKGGKLVNPKFWGTGDIPAMEADDPKNPLGERWLQLDGIAGEAVGKEGYGVHGTIEPDSIGKNMSLGCIRLLDEDIKWVYDLLLDGKSKIVIVP